MPLPGRPQEPGGEFEGGPGSEPGAKSWRRSLLILFTLAVGGAVAAPILWQRFRAEDLLAGEVARAQAELDWIASHRAVYADRDLPAETTFSQFLRAQGLDAATVERIISDARPVYDLGRVRAGNRVTVVRSGKGELRAISYRIDLDRILWMRRAGEGFQAEIQRVPYEVVVEGVAGRIHDSLFQALEEQGEAAALALEIADIFGWDIDFYTDPRAGDTFEVVVEKKILRGELLGYGRVLAAQYRNEGRLYQALRFHDPSGQPAYYAPDGKSMQKAFLRSPLKFGATVTSGFSHRRFHPILKHYRPHLGVDYSAPVGSPVQAVAEGRVVSAGWNGGGGKTIHLRHAKGYDTYYLHLSRIQVRGGQQVRQGQVIGLTGSTGLSTGPHLDFRVTQHGKFRNFLALKLPPARSVAQHDWKDFVAARDGLLEQLASLHARQDGSVEEAILRAPQGTVEKGK